MNQLVNVADGGTMVETSPVLERLKTQTVGVRPSVQLVGSTGWGVFDGSQTANPRFFNLERLKPEAIFVDSKFRKAC